MDDKLSRKELVKSYKERKTVGGIYMIKNMDTGKLFLESTNNLHGSESQFQFAKSTGQCLNKKLEKYWNEIKGCHFSFEILEELEKKDEQTAKDFKEELELLKEMWMDKLKGADFY